MNTQWHTTSVGTYATPVALSDDALVRDIAAGVIHDWRVVEAIVRYWQPGTSVLDVGTNLAQVAVCCSIATAHLVGGEGAEIIGLEARASFAEYAQENLEANHIGGTVHLAAAWDVSGTRLGMPRVDLSKFASGGSFGIVMGDEVPEEYVTSVALDDLAISARVSVIKLDVQGAELRALQGARGILREHAPTVIFEFEEMFAPDFGTTFGDYVDFLSEMDYGIREVVGSSNFLALPNDYYRDLAVSDFNIKRRRLPESVFRAGIESEVSRRRSLVF